METYQIIPSDLLNRIARFGRLFILDTVSSTNDFAFTLVPRGEPAIVVTRKQTKGRGRFHRKWFSDEESLIFSVLLFLEKKLFAPGCITQFAGVALCRAIERLTEKNLSEKLPPLIRWPNDVIIQNKKVAGILCEQRKNAIVVGIGINVNQSALPEDLPEASSLFQIYHQRFDKMTLLEVFLNEFFTFLEQLKKAATDELWNEVKNRSAILHKRVEIRTLLRRHIGTVIDIDNEGRVILRKDSGKLEVFNAGQVKQLR